jgi:hypothetical protein
MRSNFRIRRSIDKMSYRSAIIQSYRNWLIEEIDSSQMVVVIFANLIQAQHN